MEEETQNPPEGVYVPGKRFFKKIEVVQRPPDKFSDYHIPGEIENQVGLHTLKTKTENGIRYIITNQEREEYDT